MIVGLDVDGVVQDTYTYILDELGLDCDLFTDYRMELLKEHKKEIRQLFSDPRTVVGAPPCEGAVEAVTKIVHSVDPLSCLRHSILFLTGLQDKSQMPLREWWLDKYFGDLVEIEEGWTLNWVSADNRPAMAKRFGCRVFVEDRRATANAIAEAGIRSILVPSSYHADGPIHPDVKVMTLMEFAESLS